MQNHASDASIFEHILGLERAALHRWGRGDPSGYLELSAHDVVYMDPFVKQPVHGIEALSAYYEPIRGTIFVLRDEIRNAHVELADNVAVLTFQYFSEGSEQTMLWNCTEVYRRWHRPQVVAAGSAHAQDGAAQGYRIISTHWSFAGT